MRGDDIGDGWVEHTVPRGYSKYYYNSHLKLVTEEDMRDDKTRRTFLSKYREKAEQNCPSDTLVYQGKVYVMNHATETFGNQDNSGAYSEK